MTRLTRSLILSCLILGCESPGAPQGGALAISAEIVGPAVPVTVLEVSVDGVVYPGVSGPAPLVIGPLATGDHQVALQGLPRQCAVEGAHPRAVTVTPGDTVATEFVVRCEDAAATMTVTVSSEGQEIDPNGYRILLDGHIAGPISTSGAFTVAAPPGAHIVELGHVTANCAAERNPREIIVPSGGSLTTTHFDVSCAVAPPAGRRHEIAFFTDRTGSGSTHGDEIYLMNEDGTGIRPVAGTSGPLEYGQPAWSPDGSRLLLTGSTGLIMLDLAEGVATPVPNTAAGIEPAWSPDGTRIAFIGNSGEDPQIWLAEVDGSNARPVTSESRASPPSSPTWSPDGTRLAFVSQENSPDFTIGRIVILDLQTGNRDTVYTDEGDFLGEVAWSPDGTKLAFSGPTADSFEDRIQILDLAGDSAPLPVSSGGADTQPSWSPDGTRIAFTRMSFGEADIYTVNLDGSEEVTITNEPGFDSDPAWRP